MGMANAPVEHKEIVLAVNGVHYRRLVPVRKTLADFLRDDLGLTGTHLGCEHGICGACTVQVDGEAVRSCLLLAVQCHGAEVRTVEGLSLEGDHPLQEAFHRHHALQCGFCTPGVLLSMDAFLRACPNPSEEQVRAALAGNLCRCTGYEGIVRAVCHAARFYAGDLRP